MEKEFIIVSPLTSLTSNQCKRDWTNKHQKAFKAIKNVILRKTLLSYPDFNQPFDIHTNASDLQLDAVISQNKKPIAFYNWKLNPAQKWYTTTEKELLAIVETLQKF